MQIELKNIKNVLAVRNDRFGEFLLNIPAFRSLKETFTNARLIVVTDPYIKELAHCVPFIDEVIGWGHSKHSLLQKIKLIRLLKRKNIDISIILNPSKEFNILTYLSGIPIRVGYAKKCDFLLTHKIEDKKYLGINHEIEYNLELVSLVGAKTHDKTLFLTIDNDISNSLLKDFNIENSDNLVALHPWTSDPIKQWPLKNFYELAKELLAEQKIRIILIGGKDEVSKSRELYTNLGSNLINMTGRTTLRQLAALLKRCKLLISCDSGPVHLASCVGTSVIAIFRNDIPAKSAIRWGPQGKGHIVIEKNNLSDITVEELLAKIKQKLYT